MKQTFFLAAFLTLFLVSCGSSAPQIAETADTVIVRNFHGTLPGADVPGIIYDLTLTGTSSAAVEGDYNLSMTYLEAEDGKDKTFDSEGTWSLLDNTQVTSHDSVYQLIASGTPPDTTHFLYLSDRLILLGEGLVEPAAGLNYTLILQP